MCRVLSHHFGLIMAGFDDSEQHSAKRMRTEQEDDPHKPKPSKVVHVRGLNGDASKEDLVEAVQHFGSIAYVMMLPKNRQALVEFGDQNDAMSLIRYCQDSAIYVSGMPAFFNYSTSSSIKRPPGATGIGLEPTPENKVLLLTILNAKYPIGVEVIHTICSPSGQVDRIVIFKKTGVQAMVEFNSVDGATRAKQALHGCDIYSGCCTLKIEYAKPTQLNVRTNDPDSSWDYTNPNPGGSGASSAAPNKALLADPVGFGGPPGYGGANPAASGPYDQSGFRRGEKRGYSGGEGPPPVGPPASGMYGDSSRGPGTGFGYNGRGSGYQDDYRGRSQGLMGGGGVGGGGGPAVVMVYGMNMAKMNADRLFNLLCLYGNVHKVKFLKTKEGSAMVEMGDSTAVERAVNNLNYTVFFDNKMTLGFSKQDCLQPVSSPYTLPDGSPSYKDFMGSRNNRFSTPESAAKNRVQPPSKVLHYYNTPPNFSDDDMKQIFVSLGVAPPAKMKQFPSKSDRSSTGLLEWDDTTEALAALVICNHHPIENSVQGRSPYIFKICFSNSPIMDKPFPN